MDCRNIFSSRISALRKGKRLSCASVGISLCVSDETIRLLEHGKRSPSFELFIALADFYNVSLDYLAGRSDRKELPDAK